MLKIKKLQQRQDVYDFTVLGNNNFYCNDILVHNCSEKPLVPYGTCLLGSLNMGMFPIHPEEYKPILKEKTSNLVRLIDCAIQYEIDEKRYGVVEQRDIMELTREIGLGYTNVHQWFINAGVQYDSDEAIEMIGTFMKWYSFYAFEASQDLAEEKGPAGAYSEVEFTNKDLYNSIFFKNIVHAFYDGDWTKVRQLRNLALISIAPTGCGVVSNKFITDKGPITIESVLEKEEIRQPKVDGLWFNLKYPLNVKVKDDKFVEVNKIFYNGKRKTRKLIFEDGLEVEFTHNHPLLVKCSDGTEAWKQVNELNTGDDILQY